MGPNPILRARNTRRYIPKAVCDHEHSNSGRAQASRLAPRPPRAQSRCQRYRAQKIDHGVYAPSNEQLLGIQIALERAGVAFTAGDAPSVKLRKTTKRRE
jgi:hypothetical protein